MELTSISRLKLLLSLGAGIIVSVIVLNTFISSSTAVVNDLVQNNDVTKVYLSTSTIPLRVSGVVSAAESTIVYAETAGVVTSLPIREGGIAEVGVLMVTQATPVADARLQLAAAEVDLVQLQQSQNIELQQGRTGQSVLRSYSATELARLRVAGNDNRIEEKKNLFQASLKQGVLTLVEAINYVNNNRSQFSAEGLRMYDQVAGSVYGNIPNYFQGGLAISLESGVDIIELLDEVEVLSGQTSSLLTLQAVGDLVQEQLSVLTQLYSTAESDMFDRQSELVTTDDQNNYITNRLAVLTAERDVKTAAAELGIVVDNAIEESLSLEVEAEVAEIDEYLMSVQSVYTKKLAEQSLLVSKASEAVVYAEQSLSRVQAPFNGVVSKVWVDVGQYVVPGTQLLTLVGSGARELEVTVPSYLLSSISKGDVFVVDDKPIGRVDRFSLVNDGGSGAVVIALSGKDVPQTGASVLGNIELTQSIDVFSVPRSHVHFDANGPYVLYENGEQSVVEVVYDTGRELFVTASLVLGEALRPALSISL